MPEFPCFPSIATNSALQQIDNLIFLHTSKQWKYMSHCHGNQITLFTCCLPDYYNPKLPGILGLWKNVICMSLSVVAPYNMT